MKTKLYLASGIIILIIALLFQRHALNIMTAQRDAYKRNNYALVKGSKEYITKDSLHASEVYGLQYKLSELKKLYADDVKTINTLNIKNRNLESLVNVSGNTKIKIVTNVKDSIIYRDNHIKDTIQNIEVNDKWYKLNATIHNNIFNGTLIVYDSLLITETVKYKRFLGFLWKTKKIKDRKLDAVNLNPYSKIQGIRLIKVN